MTMTHMDVQPLTVWLLKEGEQLPIYEAEKLQRTGMVMSELRARGHEVTWWTSTHDHHKKFYHAQSDEVRDLPNGAQLRMLHVGGYTSNVSFARIAYMKRLAKAWRMAAEKETPPDVVICSYPFMDWAWAARDYCQSKGIPFILDIRDQWPDTFADYFPAPLKPCVRLGAKVMYGKKVHRVMRDAAAIFSMSHPFLRWGLGKAKRAQGGHDQVCYLGSAIETPEMSDAQRADLPWIKAAKGRQIYVYFGTLCLTNGLDILAQSLLNAPEDVFYVIAGAGELEGEMKEVLAGKENVMFTGWMNKEQGEALLASSDIALLPGWNATMPNKVFDYLNAGLPIISAMQGESKEFIERHEIGVTCAPKDADAFAKAVWEMCQNAAPKCQASLEALDPALYSRAAIYARYADGVESVALGGSHTVPAEAAA